MAKKKWMGGFIKKNGSLTNELEMPDMEMDSKIKSVGKIKKSMSLKNLSHGSKKLGG